MWKLIAVKALLILPLTSCLTMMRSGGESGFETTTIETEPVRAVCDVTPIGEAAFAPARKWNGYTWSPVREIETPRELRLAHEAESYEITCEAEGYQKATVIVEHRVSPLILLNAVFLLGMPYAFAIDLVTTAAWFYPGSVTIELEPTEAVTD
jgi:hypothetical protein